MALAIAAGGGMTVLALAMMSRPFPESTSTFFLLNNVFGYAGNLQNWSPWLTAAAPGLIYSALSLAAFGWLVLRR